MSAHRASYLIKTKGEPIPREIDGMTAHVRHLCGKSLCVNPDHLEIGTIVSNHQDKVVHGTGMVGERSNLAKITEEKATQIKTSKLCEEEDGFESQTERAERFGVSLVTVRNIIDRYDMVSRQGHGITSRTDLGTLPAMIVYGRENVRLIPLTKNKFGATKISRLPVKYCTSEYPSQQQTRGGAIFQETAGTSPDALRMDTAKFRFWEAQGRACHELRNRYKEGN